MATFNQRDDALRGYVGDVDIEQYGKVLLGLQAGYDKNVGTLNETEQALKKIAENTNLRPEAKEYFYKRMRERKDVLEKNVGNFAFANELDYGMKVLNSAVDDVVAVEQYNGSIPKNIFTQHTKLAEGKHPELANSVNLEYSLQDINKWQNTKGHLGKKFQGNSTYVPYVDIVKTIDTEVKRQIPNAFAIATESGLQIKTSEGKFLSPSRVKEIVDMAKNANPQIAKQLEINGWNQYRGIDDSKFLAGAKGKLTEFIKNYEASAKAEEARTAGANLIEGTPIGEDAKRSKAYNENAAKYYREILVGKDGKSGLMAMQNLSPEDRRRLETLFTEEKVKDTAANSFAYFSVNKSDIKLNEAATFQANYAQKQEEIDIRGFDAQTARLKALKELNPNATYEDAVGAGINPQLAASAMLNPNTTMVNPSEVPKTEDIDESLTQLKAIKEQNFTDIKETAYNIAILQGKSDKEASEQAAIFDASKYSSQTEMNNAVNQYTQSLNAALANKKEMTPSLSRLIQKHNDALSGAKRVVKTEKEYLASIGKEQETIKGGNYFDNINKGRFVKTTGSAGILGLQDAYIDNVTGEKVSTHEARELSKSAPQIDASLFIPKRVDVLGVIKYEHITSKQEYDERGAILVSEEAKRKGSVSNLNRAAKKNGIMLLASGGTAYTTKDPNLIAGALRFTTDEELKKYGLADIKDIKESINKAITDKDAKDFPIAEMNVNIDGSIVLVKSDGGSVKITGYSQLSQIGKFATSVVQQQQRQDDNLTKSMALISDANVNYNESGKRVMLDPIGGNNSYAEVYYKPFDDKKGNEGKIHVKIYYYDENGSKQEKVLEDETGESLIPVSKQDYNNVNINAKVEEMIKRYHEELKNTRKIVDNLRKQNGGK